VEELTAELGLPSNQVLAMFNKAVRKISIALNAIVEEDEKSSMLGGDKRRKAEAAASKMRNVVPQTLEEDATEAASAAMSKLTNNDKQLPKEVADEYDIMQYAIKGSEADWSQALEGREVDESGVVSVKSVRKAKRKLEEKDIALEGQTNADAKKGKKEKQKRKSKK
jgi:N-acetyltransferase 10